MFRLKLLFVLGLVGLLSINMVNSLDCNSLQLEQLSANIVCDGSPFMVSLNYLGKNPWGDFIVARLYPSSGFQMESFPEVELRNIGFDQIKFQMSCRDVSSGYVEANIIDENQAMCQINLDLENVNLPSKNSNGEIVTNVDSLQGDDIEYLEKSNNSKYILILVGIAIFTMLIFLFIIFYPIKSKRFKND